jgi:hypothetical protein
VLAGFQFENGQAVASSDGQHIDDSMFGSAAGEYLGVNETRIEHGVNTSDILPHDGFQPALRLRAI